MKSMSIVFANAYVRAYLNNGCYLVVFEADFCIFNIILTPLRALYAQCPRVQTPRPSMAMEKDERTSQKKAKNNRLST